MILCYITDRRQFSGDQTEKLLAKISEAIAAGVDYIQLREKDLSSRALEELARKIQPRTTLLINSRPDIALAVGAAGVHLAAGGISPLEARRIWNAEPNAGNSGIPVVTVACHSPEEVSRTEGADFALFAPVFEKKSASPKGLKLLAEACRYPTPVLALGGVTLENAPACMQAGAAGIAAIRLFQENNIEKLVTALRQYAPK